MPKSLPDIIYKKDKITPIVDSSTSYYQMPFFKDEEYFRSLESYTAFVKACERLVRTDDRYRKYINYLKKEVKLDHCQVLKNVSDQECTIEMHHGPIFNLFDYCAIILEYFLYKNWKITTMRIADAVLTEHQMNRVQVVMLSTTMHEEVHNKDIFINYKQAYGNLNEFVDKYLSVIQGTEFGEKLNRYIDRSLLYDSNDFGMLELNKKLYQK